LAVARAQEICDARLEEAENVRLLRKVKVDRIGLRERLALDIGKTLGSLGIWLVVKVMVYSLVLYWRARDLSQRLLRPRQDPVLRGYRLSETP
jgi:hypothetical protein